jgi:hypothetical protein
MIVPHICLCNEFPSRCLSVHQTRDVGLEEHVILPGDGFHGHRKNAIVIESDEVLNKEALAGCALSGVLRELSWRVCAYGSFWVKRLSLRMNARW